MSEFKSALGLFLTGDIDLEGLDQALANELSSKPDAGPDVLLLLEQLYQSGRLPHQIYAVLKRTVLSGSAPKPTAPPSPAVPPSAGTTGYPPSLAPGSRLGPQPGAAPQASRQAKPGASTESDAERTRFQLPADKPRPGNVDDGRTRFDTLGHSRRTGRRTSPPSSSPMGQSMPTGAPATDRASGHYTGTGGSTWGHPSQWTGGGPDGDREAVLSTGSIVKGRYVLEKKIGEGGMGTVYKARDLRREEAQDRNPHVALKVLNEDFKRHPDSLKALQREARKAQDLAHPNIVNVFDFDRDGGNVYMAMELLEGEPLDRLIKRHSMCGLPKKDALAIVEGIAAGLGHAHKSRIVHSDLKPSNVYITNDGTAKVFDFGIARAAKVQDDGEHEKTMFDAGTLGALTPAYASLEMLEGDEPALRDDVYALACITYELLTGRHPFDKISADKAMRQKMRPARIKKLTRAQFRALSKGLAFERGKRSRSVEDFIQGLRPAKAQKQLLLGAAAVALLLVILLATTIPAILDARFVDELTSVVVEGPDERITERLSEIVDLADEDLFRDVFADERTQDLFIDYFSRRISEVFEPTAGRYDFMEADEFMTALEQLPYFGGRGSVERLREELQAKRDDAVANVRAELDTLRARGDLIALQNESNVVDTLAIIRLLDPGNAALSDKSIPIRFAQVANREIEAENYALARPVVEQGLDLIEQGRLVADEETRTSLVNLRDLIGSQQRRVELAARINELESSLNNRLEGLDELEAFDVVLADMQELATFAADSDTLRQVRIKLNELLSADVEALLAARRFDIAATTIERYGAQLQRGDLDALRQVVADGRQQQQALTDGLLSDLLDAIDRGELHGAAAKSAEGVLSALKQSGADAGVLMDATQSLVEAYRQRGIQARDAERWDDARESVQRGIALQPGTTLESLLESDLASIDRQQRISGSEADAERERLLIEQRLAEINSLTDAFNNALVQNSFSMAATRTLLETLRNLEQLDAPITDGRARVINRLLEEVETLRRRGRLEEAVELARQGYEVFPDARRLQAAASDLQLEMNQLFETRKAERLDATLGNIERLLREPALDQAWNGEVQKAIQALEVQLKKADPRVSDARRRIALAFVTSAAELRARDSLVNARDQLERAAWFAPGLDELAIERNALARAQADLRSRVEQSERVAALERSRQDLLAEAKAGNVSRAIEILNDLRTKLPADDAFIVRNAPTAIADSYVSLGQRQANVERFDTARQLIAKAFEWMPEYAPAKAALTRIDELETENALPEKPSQRQLLADAAQRLRGTLQAGDIAAAESQFLGLRERFPDLADDAFIREEGPRLLADARVAEGESALAARRFNDAKLAADRALIWIPEYQPGVDLQRRVREAAQPQPQPPRITDSCANPTLVGKGSNPRARCRDPLPGGGRGPSLVVVPISGLLGGALAVSAYEITISEFNMYCSKSGACSRKDGDGKLPVTEISSTDAMAYATWLTKETGFIYRLPTSEEWKHASMAAGKQPPRNYNCQVRQNGVLIKGATLLPVNVGESNGWGLKNYLGNAQEWVRDGSNWAARGGAHTDEMRDCEIGKSVAHSGQPDSITGFRLVREIKAQT